MANMSIEKAVSATVSERDRYCLLRDEESEDYRCAETATNLGATAAETRLQAYWLHYKTHIEPYARWAWNRKLFDPTVRYLAPLEAAAELVGDVLLSFHRQVQDGQYDPKRGPPCKYIKRGVKNRFQDVLRRGHHPTPEECARCYEKGGFCPLFRPERPGEQERQRCFRLPPVTEFDPVSAMFAAAGLQDQWPPLPGASSVRRSVEDPALRGVLIDSIWDFIDETLTPNQRIVLRETYLNDKTSREIALEALDTTQGNVDQIRHRGIKRLKRAGLLKDRAPGES